MKPIVCLIVLSLIIALWSTGLASPRTSTKPGGHADCPNIPPSLRRAVLRCYISRACPEPVEGFFTPSVAFAPHERLGSPLFPSRGQHFDVASCPTDRHSPYATGCWFAPHSQRDATLPCPAPGQAAQPVTRLHWLPALGLKSGRRPWPPGSCHGRTSTTCR